MRSERGGLVLTANFSTKKQPHHIYRRMNRTKLEKQWIINVQSFDVFHVTKSIFFIDVLNRKF